MADAAEDDNPFIRTIHAAEAAAQRNLGGYKFKVACFAMLGYAVIFAALAVLLSLVIGIGAAAFISTAIFLILLKKKLLFVLLPAIWVLLKALWVKVEAPAGYRLEKTRFPALHEQIDELSRTLRTPRIHQVLLVPELNAAVSQTPRLGPLGWYRNTLIIGLELLLVLTPEQARAVLAHEFGHLSGNHARMHGWIYRLRMTWSQVLYAFEGEQSFGARLMGRFVRWYAPRFNAYSFVLARQHEYEADAISAELTTPAATGDALVNVHVTAPYVDKAYWGALQTSIREQAEPPTAPYGNLREFLQNQPPSGEQLTSQLGEVLKEATSYDDTHPCLAERLDALSRPAALPAGVAAPAESAAERWLGQELGAVIADFDRDWLAHNADPWRERHRYLVEGERELDQYAERFPDLSDEDAWRYGRLLLDLHDGSRAKPVFELLHARQPKDPQCAWVLGQIRMHENDETFIELMRVAREHSDPDVALCAAQWTADWLQGRERLDEAREWHGAAERLSAAYEAGNAERAQLRPKDPLQAAQLDEAELTRLREILAQTGVVKHAWIAQKVVQHFPGQPARAIAFTLKGMHLSAEGPMEKVIEAVAGDEQAMVCFVAAHSGETKKLAKRIKKAGQQVL